MVNKNKVRQSEIVKKPTVLIVDDEESVRLFVRRLLRDEFNVIEARDGRLAVNAARGYKPNLILMDIMMPDMDGYTACSIIKNDDSTRNIPIIMLTAIGYELNKRLAEEMGAEGYLTKPFDFHELLRTIEEVLKGRK